MHGMIIKLDKAYIFSTNLRQSILPVFSETRRGSPVDRRPSTAEARPKAKSTPSVK